MFEYTEEYIVDQFKDDSRKTLWDRMMRLPCLFCGEGIEDETAYIGQIDHVETTGKDLSLSVKLDEDIPPLQNSILYAKRMELNMAEGFEFSRNHWAVKDVDLYHFLLHHSLHRKPRPTVFQLPKHESIDPTLVSVMMPFSAEFDSVYDAIRQAATNAKLQCMRADDIWKNDTIIQDVIDLIYRSKIVVWIVQVKILMCFMRQV